MQAIFCTSLATQTLNDLRSCVTTALLKVEPEPGKPSPLFVEVVHALELLHRALVKHSDLGQGPSPSFTGNRHGIHTIGHQHAALMPLPLEANSPLCDAAEVPLAQVLVHAPAGLDAAAQYALRSVCRIYGRRLSYRVALAALGTTSDVSVRISALASSTMWTSATPFVPPRYVKHNGRNTLLGQVLLELETRNIAKPLRVEAELDSNRWLDLGLASASAPRPAFRWNRFHCARAHRDRRPPATAAFGLRLVFGEPISGPLSLGYASHFGLGMFVPVDASAT